MAAAKVLGNGLSLVVVTAGLVISLVGIATPNWASFYDDEDQINYNTGLWRACMTDYSPNYDHKETLCGYIGLIDLPAWLHATRAMVIISIIPFVVGCILAVIAFIKDSAVMLIATGVSILAEAVLQFIGLVVWTAMYKPNPIVAYRWSYYLCWISVAVLIVGSITFFIQAAFIRKVKDNEQESLNCQGSVTYSSTN